MMSPGIVLVEEEAKKFSGILKILIGKICRFRGRRKVVCEGFLENYHVCL